MEDNFNLSSVNNAYNKRSRTGKPNTNMMDGEQYLKPGKREKNVSNHSIVLTLLFWLMLREREHLILVCIAIDLKHQFLHYLQAIMFL